MTTFEVIGHGAFPLDMLRYDECWPTRGVDAWFIAEIHRRRVRLSTNKRFAPTAGRWESFGWTVANELEEG